MGSIILCLVAAGRRIRGLRGERACRFVSSCVVDVWADGWGQCQLVSAQLSVCVGDSADRSGGGGVEASALVGRSVGRGGGGDWT